MPTVDRTTNRALTALVAIVATILVGWVFTTAAVILQPLVIAALLCNVLQPVVKLLRRVHIPAWLTVVLLLILLVMAMVEGGTLFFSELRAYRDAGGLELIRNQAIAWLERHDLPFTTTIIETVREFDPKTGLVSAVGTVTDFVRGSFLVVLYMIFIFAEQAIFRDKILAVAAGRRREAERVLDSISYGIQRYLGVKTVISLLTGVLCFLVLQVLQLPYAPLFGLLTFLLNYIPTFGSFVAAVFPIATSLARADGLTEPLIVTATYLVVNVSLGSILEPRLLGRELNLSPLVILVSVVVWAGLWGVPGTFLAVPLTAMLQIVLANIESTRPLAVLLSNGVPKPRPAAARDETDGESDARAA